MSAASFTTGHPTATTTTKITPADDIFVPLRRVSCFSNSAYADNIETEDRGARVVITATYTDNLDIVGPVARIAITATLS